MPNLSGLPALDLLIGLAFLYFLLSTVCSAINEAIANVLGWRAKTLEDAIRNLLGDPKVKKGLREWFGGVKKRGVKTLERAGQEVTVAVEKDGVRVTGRPHV